MNEEKIRSTLSNNLIEYRKLHGMTQLELAEKLNYSDKAISKWERGESVPDIYVLACLAEMYSITVNDLLQEKKLPKKPKSSTRWFLTSLIYAGFVWLLATVVFVLITMIDQSVPRIWLAFIYAIPASAIVFLVFSEIVKNKVLSFLSVTVMIWTLALSLHLTIDGISWMFYIMAIPVQILTSLWYLLIRLRK